MWLSGVYLCVLGYTALANAMYYIDDQDSSITYNSSAGVGYNKKWLKYSYEHSNSLAVSVNETICFNGTATYTQCETSDHCSMTIPFNGTGITLFVAQDVGDIYNTSISLDNGPATNHFAYTPPNATAEAYNVSLYDIQGLDSTTHSLKVELAPGVSRLLFDYAAVTGNQTSKPSGNQPSKPSGNGVSGKIISPL
ncbi:hypothetical protein B0H11DRAFT_2074681 [Mycena galericulata]|nr:hypothetical protein B0H11DRAFT_2074681 [Mycena galericulata]